MGEEDRVVDNDGLDGGLLVTGGGVDRGYLLVKKQRCRRLRVVASMVVVDSWLVVAARLVVFWKVDTIASGMMIAGKRRIALPQI